MIASDVCVRLKNLCRGLRVKDGEFDSKVDILFFCHDADRGITLAGKAYAPLIDSVYEDMKNRGYNCATLAHPWSTRVDHEAFGRVVSMNRRYFRALILDRLCRYLRIPVNKNAVVKAFEFLIQSSGAKLVITIGASPEISQSCHNLNLKHAELLHSVGYSKIEWNWESREKESLPSYILSMDPLSTKTFSGLCSKGVRVLQVPHPFIKRFFLSKYKKEIPQEWRPKDIRVSDKRRILICLQWGYSGELPQFENILDNGLYPQIFNDLFKLTLDEIEWCLRLHPVQITDSAYTSHCELVTNLATQFRNVSWESWTESPLPLLLPLADGCLSMSSMSSYDAAYFGIPSLLLCPMLRSGGCDEEWFEDLVEAGYAQKREATLTNLYEWAINVRKKEPYLCNITSDGAWELALEALLESSVNR